MNFLEELRWRNLLQDTTEGLEEMLLSQKPVRGYIGFDPTAPSLGIGNFVQIATLRRFQQAGHQPVILLGGATGRIGDPSGKDQERSLLDLEALERNIAKQREQFSKFLDFNESSPNHALVANNWDFYKDMNVMTFLRDIGKYITVNYMLSKDSVKNRINKEEGISFTEFSYQIIQGNDFEYLYKNMNCQLQMGGGDQWGNITTGLEFIRKKGGKAHGLCTKLLTKKDGKKFGKSEKGNLFLDPAMTSPYEFYQYWLGSQIDDEDLPNLYRVLSFRSRQEIEQIEHDFKDNPIERRRLLAEELTVFIHDEQALVQAQQATQIVHNPKFSADFLHQLTPNTWDAVGREVGQHTYSRAELDGGMSIVKILTETGLCASNSEVRKAIQNNGIALNAEKVTSHEFQLTADNLINGKYMLVQNGKKNKYVLVFE